LILSGQDHFSSTARETGDIPYMIAEINRNTYAIGYETLFMVQRENKPLKILEVDNIHPANQEALAKGFYPFYRTYSLTTWQQPENNLNAEKLIDYLSRYIDEHAQQLRIVPISELQKQGWLVSDGELIGEPGNAGLVSMEVE
jgi:ABC-type phosphate transport system substrate-binding protein